MSLHNKIKNFYLKCLKPLFSIEVLSENGEWNKIETLNITDKQYFYKLTTTAYSLYCTEKHILIDKDGKEIFAINALGHYIRTQSGIQQILSVEKTEVYDNAYDLSLKDNTTHLYFCNGFLSHNCVIIDEMAFIPKNIIDEFFASVMPVISSAKNSKAIIVSTPNGASGLYYEIWQQANSIDASKNVEGWKPFRIDWWEVPNRDEKWKQQQIATVGMDKWLQEFCNEFAAGSSTQKLIPDDIIEKFRRRITELKTTGELKGKIQKITSETNQRVYDFTMWHEFKQGHSYVAAVDVAEGTGGDSSVLYVFDISDIRKITMCAKFASATVSTIEFAFITARILKLYNNPWLICESNGIGSGYLDSLRITYGYENIVREGKDNKYGITSHVQVKGKACLWLREMFTTNGVAWEIYDPDLVEEMGHFIKKDSKVHLVYNAAMGAHDDHMMALCWAAWILNPDVIERYYVVVESFKSDLEKILPKKIAPLKEPTNEEISQIINDPFYIEYMKFKQEILQKLNNTANIMQLKKQNDKRKPSFNQLFFGEADDNEWGNPWIPIQQNIDYSAQSTLQMPTSCQPMYFL